MNNLSELLDFLVGTGLLSFASYLIFYGDLMLGVGLGIVGACVALRSLRK